MKPKAKHYEQAIKEEVKTTENPDKLYLLNRLYERAKELATNERDGDAEKT